MNLKCPFCGSEKFLRITKEVITIEDNGETLTDNLEKFLSVEYKCLKCKKNVTESELTR